MENGFSNAANYPYMMGVLLAVNAVSDLHLYVDGPDCVIYKSQYICKRHDLNSTLTACDGEDRLRVSKAHINVIGNDRTDAIVSGLRDMERLPGAAGIVYTSMPMATIVGTPYDLIIRDMSPPLEKPLYAVPALSLSGDWLDGYAQVFKSLALGVDLSGGRPHPDQVAVVGYAMDRTEDDHTANIRELERMLRALGLEPVSVWPSRRPLDHLQAVKHAGTILSMPHAREAAAELARRTGATLIETDIPLGLEPTCRWLRRVAEPLGRAQQAEQFIAAELAAVIPAIQWLVHRVFLRTGAVFAGDPHYFRAMHECLTELGVHVHGMVSVGGAHHLPALPRALAAAGVKCVFDTSHGEMESLLQELRKDDAVDLAIGNDLLRNALGAFGTRPAFVPFGFTNYHFHAVYDTPFLGFRGARCFIGRITNELLRRVSLRD